MVSAATGTRQDMVHVHHPEGEVCSTACTDTFLHPIEAMPMGAVVGSLPRSVRLGGLSGTVGPGHNGRSSLMR